MATENIAADSEEPEVQTPEQPEEDYLSSQGEWFVIHTYSGYENKVKTNLEHRIDSMDMTGKIFKVVIPVEDEVEVRDGQRRTVQRKVFPGYVLVQMDMSDDSWYVVRNTPGVTGFVGPASKPVPLVEAEIRAILKPKTDAPKVKIAFQVGQSIRVIDGPFSEFVGVVDGVYPEKGKIRVMLSFLGRETPVELDFLQIEKL